jgi:hypothetical protein
MVSVQKEDRMGQLNVHMTPEFEETLRRYMRLRGIRTKSDAVRLAVVEGVERARREAPAADFTSWLGLGCAAPENPSPRFRNDDDLWK